ncbi:MAG: diaminopimelate epimerase [Coriobacteriales bacterium]|jgi:diaminopimelate epimerase
MKYDFVKIHGAGNDFVFIEDMRDSLSFSQDQIAFICDRHFGVGADGLILVKPAKDDANDAFMDYYNSDGTKAQMCGNGVRCFAKYLVDNGLVDSSSGSLDAETRAGVKHIEYKLDGERRLVLARVDMGLPILEGPKVPTTLPVNSDGMVILAPLDTPFGHFDCTCVSMGNPHCVIFMPDSSYFTDPGSFDIRGVGPYLECHDVFPEKCNIEFVHVDGMDGDWAQIHMRVWERGDGETLACGTGACAAGVAAYLTGQAGRKAHVHLLGGTLDIEWREDGHVMMTGPAVESFRGTIEF